MTTPTSTGLAIDDLETVYDELAAAIDAAGERGELLLVKLALLSAEALGDAGRFRDLLARAQRDL